MPEPRVNPCLSSHDVPVTTTRSGFFSHQRDDPSISPPSIHFLHDPDFLCKPAFTEAAYVGCHFAAFATTVRRLAHEGDQGLKSESLYWHRRADSMAMDQDASSELQRTASHRSASSARSQRSQTVRVKPRKYSSYISSSASSISDKSLRQRSCIIR